MYDNFIDAAKVFISANIPVLPVCAIVDGKPLCKNPNCSGSKHPLSVLVPHGVKDATTNLAIIQSWNAKFPKANIGIATGSISGILALDIDPKNGGNESLKQLIAKHGELSQTPSVVTGSGGYHYYFQHPSQPVTNKTGLFPGIDIKTDGGYVVAPPSLHLNGNHYEWLVTLDETPFAPVPDWLLQTLVTPKSPESPTPNNGTAVFSEGQRNAELTRIAGRLRRQGLGMEALSAALVALNNEKCSPALPHAEVMLIAKSISSKECPELAALVPPTDSGNAELFATMFSDSVRYDHQRGSWLLWEKHWWRPDEERQVLLLAKDVARERQRCLSDHSSKEARKFALTSESKAPLEAKLDGKIAEEFWQRKMIEWQADEQRIEAAITGLKESGSDRLLSVRRILELANKAYFLYLTRKPAEQAELLRKVLLNCSIDAVSVTPTYRKPFDMIFQRAKNNEWSGREDLNLRPPGPELKNLCRINNF
jgi:putative DNA primase/helicase